MTEGIRLKTGISKVRWCDPAGGKYNFNPAIMPGVMKDQDAKEMCWFDELLHGGILLREQTGGKKRAVTLLITGPPGTGKSTLAMELCIRMAAPAEANPLNGKALYVVVEAHPPWMLDNADSFGLLKRNRRKVKGRLGRERLETEKEVRKRLFSFGSKPSDAAISICTLEEIKKEPGEQFKIYSDIFSLNRPWTSSQPNLHPVQEKVGKPKPKIISAADFDIVVIDSLNCVANDKSGEFNSLYNNLVESGHKLIIFILDSSPAPQAADPWEFASDIVLRLDRNDASGYMIRTLEVIKARYQAHVWGKHQLKIQEPLLSEDILEKAPDEILTARRLRAHPWAEGGIFIFPSIHYILSRYKREAPFSDGTKTVETPLASLNELLKAGIPAGRTTALLGGRGTHKSHLGYLVALQTVLRPEGAGKSIIISLRDDEAMTKGTLRKILREHWPQLPTDDPDKEEEPNNTIPDTLQKLLEEGKLEIVYYPPGYVTPEEFFHRMLLSIYRMRAQDRSCGITLLFNSLDQIASRFPLCAKERVFIPGIIQTLSSIGVTSVFVGADTEGIDKSLRDLLSMAELIVRFKRKKKYAKETFIKILSDAKDQWKTGVTADNLASKLEKVEDTFPITELTVERYAGGQPAGAHGMLELVTTESVATEVLPLGLHFIPYRNTHAYIRPTEQPDAQV
jgi:KaiC/GvpD/RAD55 family RecA-like ATPase